MALLVLGKKRHMAQKHRELGAGRRAPSILAQQTRNTPEILRGEEDTAQACPAIWEGRGGLPAAPNEQGVVGKCLSFLLC